MLASTNLTNWLRFCGSAAIRYALLSALRTTFPARRPQTEADCPQLQTGSQMRQSAIDAFRILQSLIEKLVGHSLAGATAQ